MDPMLVVGPLVAVVALLWLAVAGRRSRGGDGVRWSGDGSDGSGCDAGDGGGCDGGGGGD